MVVGAPGSGKSTLARRLGALTGLSVVHMDCIHWQPGWTERPRPEKIALIRAREQEEAWIIEGGLSATYETRLARAELLVWLDLPLALRLWRVARRTLTGYGTTRPDLPEGCPEQFDRDFYRYIIVTRRRNRARLAALADRAPALRHFTSTRAVDRWLARVKLTGLPG